MNNVNFSKRVLSLSLLLIFLFNIGFTYASSNKATTNNQQKPVIITLEAEKFKMFDSVIKKSLKGFSGIGYVEFTSGGFSSITTEINITKSADYIIQIQDYLLKGKSIPIFEIYIDFELVGKMKPSQINKFGIDTLYKKVYIKQGKHTLAIIMKGDYGIIDKVMLEELNATNKAKLTIKPKLVTPNPHPNAVKLMEYLTSIYGSKILSGQQVYEQLNEINIIYRETGKLPAVLGLDFIDYSPSRVEHGAKSSMTDLAIKWWKSNGIVTFCWHWNAPMNLIDSQDKPWWRGFYTDSTTFDLKKAMDNKNSQEYKLIIRDIDTIANELKKLQKAGVPVLWRPLHEASGGWFWWGAKGPEPYKKLWILMFDRLVNYHKLNNLIWVWNGQNEKWYPGDQYVDIIGEDIYDGERNYSSKKERFINALAYSSTPKIITLSETGTIPDPDLLKSERVPWSWFCTWGGEFVYQGTDYSEKWTEKKMLKKVYNSDYVITKDELPFKATEKFDLIYEEYIPENDNNKTANDSDTNTQQTTEENLTATEKNNAEALLFGNKDIIYDFEKDTMGWSKAWGGAFDSEKIVPVEYSNDLKTKNNVGSLKVYTNYSGGDWEEANISVTFKKDGSKFDLSKYKKIEYDVYLPDPNNWSKDGILKIGSALNNKWADIGDFVDYVVPEIKDKKTINGVEYAVIHRVDQFKDGVDRANSTNLVIRFGSWKLIYKGPIYIDNIKVSLN
ncbi:glycosyl hydrolase [Caldicellulosiruptoraceae bacterium PP1]